MDLENLPQHTRRITPADKPSVLDEWKQIEKYFVEELKKSKHQAHIEISKRYKTGVSTVSSFLRYGKSFKKIHPQKYEDLKKTPNYAKQNNQYKRFRYNPAKHIVPLFTNPEEAITLEELSLRIKQEYSFLPRIYRLEALVEKAHEENKNPILQQIFQNPETYKLMPGYYEAFSPKPK